MTQLENNNVSTDQHFGSNILKRFEISKRSTSQFKYSIFTKCYAEFLGTFILIFCGTMQANVYDIMQPDGLTHSAFTHGFTIIVITATFRHISGGHFNPVVSWACFITNNLSIIHFPFFVFSQFFGGFSANLLSAVLQKNRPFIQWINTKQLNFPFNETIIEYGYDRKRNSMWEKTIMLTTQLAATSSGATTLNLTSSWWEGLISETITTFFLITIVLLNSIDNDSVIAPFVIGMMAMADIFATASITGTAMNPVRALSPNIVAEIVLSSNSIPFGFWKYHYIYWVGPFLGSTIAAISYRLCLARNNRLIS